MRIRLGLLLLVVFGCSNTTPPPPPLKAPNSTTLAQDAEAPTTKQRQKQRAAPASLDDTGQAQPDDANQVKERPILPMRLMSSSSFAKEIKRMNTCSGDTAAELKRCDAYQRVLKILSDRDTKAAHRRFLKTSAGNRLLSDPSPNVRWLAIRLLRSIAQVENSSRQKLKLRLGVEKQPLVLETLLRTLGLFVAEDTKLRQQYMKFADHDSDRVRAASLRWLANLNDPTDEALAKLLASKLKDDPSKAVGKAICLEIALRPQDAGIERLVEVVASVEHEANAPCFLALTSTWIAPSLPNLSQLGFSETLKELARRLENNVKIPWSVMSRLGQGRHLMLDSKLSAVQLEGLRAQLLACVHAPSQDIQVRMSAVQALATYGAGAETFQAIVAAYKSANDYSFQLSARAKLFRDQISKKGK